MTLPLIAAVAVAALALSACGGPGSLGVASVGNASVGSTTTTNRPLPAATTRNGINGAKYRAAFAYVSCMRSHGVPNFPDPTSDGQINVQFAIGGKDGSPATSGIDRMSPRYLSADQSCRPLLPGGVPTPAQNQRALARDVKFARCMRSHGVTNFPDPTSAGVVRLLGVDQNSPQYLSAEKVCPSLVPGADSK